MKLKPMTSLVGRAWGIYEHSILHPIAWHKGLAWAPLIETSPPQHIASHQGLSCIRYFKCETSYETYEACFLYSPSKIVSDSHGREILRACRTKSKVAPNEDSPVKRFFYNLFNNNALIAGPVHLVKIKDDERKIRMLGVLGVSSAGTRGSPLTRIMWRFPTVLNVNDIEPSNLMKSTGFLSSIDTLEHLSIDVTNSHITCHATSDPQMSNKKHSSIPIPKESSNGRTFFPLLCLAFSADNLDDMPLDIPVILDDRLLDSAKKERAASHRYAELQKKLKHLKNTTFNMADLAGDSHSHPDFLLTINLSLGKSDKQSPTNFAAPEFVVPAPPPPQQTWSSEFGDDEQIYRISLCLQRCSILQQYRDKIHIGLFQWGLDS